MRNIIHVTNLYHARHIAKDYDVTISLGWDIEAEFRKPGSKHLFIDVDDIEFADLEGKDREMYTKPGSKFIIPNMGHVHQIMDFARSTKQGEKILINCYAGYSRSPATAIIVLTTLGIKTFIHAQQTINEHVIPPDHYIDGVKPNDILLNQFALR